MNKNLFALSVKDFLNPVMLKYAILPFIITLVVMYILFFALAGVGLDQFHTTFDVNTAQTTINGGVVQTNTFVAHLQNSSIIKFLMQYAITSWLAAFLVYAIGGFLVLYLSIFIAIIVLGFMSPFVLKKLQKIHYRDVEMIGYSNALEGVFLLFKWGAIMLLLLILFIPLYFFPLINVVALNFPLYYFFHKMMTYDIASHITTREEDLQIKYFKKGSLRVKTFILYLVSLIPFAIFFGAIFYIIYLGHTYFVEVKKIRDERGVR